MPTWIVFRHGPPQSGEAATARSVVGSVTADDERDARLSAYSRWMSDVRDRLEVVPEEKATEAECRDARRRAHLDLAEERRRLAAVFTDRLSL